LMYLAHWRTYRKHDQVSLAAAAGVSVGTIKRAERDKSANVSYATIRKLAAALKTTPDALFFPAPNQATYDPNEVTQGGQDRG
jgi:transcriptional regulator with XRE-family HTH domain